MHGVPNRSSPSQFQAAPFAVRHPFLVHGILVVLCWSPYEIDRVDVVWRFVRHSANAHVLEHIGFALAALSIGVGIWLGAWPGGRRANLTVSDPRSIRRRSVGEILHASGIATLLPVAGALLMVFGEAIRSTRYARWKLNASTAQFGPPAPASVISAPMQPGRLALRHIAGICAFLSMLAFSITLRDRLADGLFAATALVFVISRFIDPP